MPVGSDSYRLVIINSGGQGQTVGSTGASTELGYRLAAYSAASGGDLLKAADAGWEHLDLDALIHRFLH